MSSIQYHTRLTNLSRLCSGLNKQSLSTNLVIVNDNNECMHTSHQHISSTSKLHTTAASKLACEHKSAQVSSLQNVKLHDLGSWQIHSKHTPTQTCCGVTLSCLMLDCTAWTMWMMLCMFKSSSQAGNKASMSSVSIKMLLCQSNPSKSMNLGTEDFWMEAALHKVFAVSDQPKASTVLTWAAHPVDNIPHPYPSLPCSALWLLATVEVWPSKASPAWASTNKACKLVCPVMPLHPNLFACLAKQDGVYSFMHAQAHHHHGCFCQQIMQPQYLSPTNLAPGCMVTASTLLAML